MSFELHVPEGWSQVKLSDLGEVNRGRSRHRPRDAAHLYGGLYPFVQTGDVKASKGRITQHSQTYSEEGLAQSRLWPKGTMCITIAANIAETGILTYPACFPDSVIGFIADESKCNVYFIEYVFRLLRKRIQAQATGSVQDNINLQTLERLLFPIPALEEQNRIAVVLGELDDKIHLNYEINQTLEQMAQAIFKSWFVDFEPVKAKMNGEQPEGIDAATASLFPEKLVESELGLIPEGWEVGELSDLMDFNPKRTLKKGTVAPYLDMKNMPTAGHLALDIYDREMGSGTKFVNGDALLARITPCLENGKTAFVDFLEDEQVGWGSTEYIVMRSKSDSYKYFSYFMARFEPFRKFAIQSMTGTSGRQRAQAKTVQTMPFVIPPLSILEKFDELITANMKLIKRHGDENKTLAQLRDTLLPKLLSGEIDLSQTEQMVEIS